ncbi:MAG: DUF1707 SHOCT-like domain-containing protein [Mycobacteriales bacterium]
MSEPPRSELPVNELPVNDDQRHAADRRLQQAVGHGQLSLADYEERVQGIWRAETIADLEAALGEPYAAWAGPGPSQLAPGPPASAPRSRWGIAVLGNQVLTGPVAPGRPIRAAAVLGETRIDLRRSDLPATLEVDAVAALGTVEILVPVGTSVEVNSVDVLSRRQGYLEPAQPGAPVVAVRAYSVLGTVVIAHQPLAHRPGLAAAGAGAVSPWEWKRAVVAPRRRFRRRRRRWAIAAIAVAAVLAADAGGATVGIPHAGTFGNRTIDVAPVPAGQTFVVRVGDVFGRVVVVVPNGDRVELTGSQVFGSESCAACGVATLPGAGVVRVVVGGVFGNVRIVTAQQAASQ